MHARERETHELLNCLDDEVLSKLLEKRILGFDIPKKLWYGKLEEIHHSCNFIESACKPSMEAIRCLEMSALEELGAISMFVTFRSNLIRAHFSQCDTCFINLIAIGQHASRCLTKFVIRDEM